MTTTERYRYGDLQLSNSIRLLRLKSGFDSEPISCSLFEASLDDIPEYEAISYTWGDASVREDVLCDNYPLSVTANLADALRRMRLKHASRLLWADAICISQSNIEERNQQVSIMRQIYGSAARVLVWLGPANKESHLALNFVELLAGSQCKLAEVSSPSSCTDDELEHVLDGPLDSSQYHETFDAVSIPDRSSIMNFFRRPWFRRVWVIQEVTRGTPITILCGEKAMNWKIFAIGVRVIGMCVRMNQLWPIAQIDHETEVGLIHICSTLSKLSWLRELSFADMLYYASNYDATDIRDKIYALLGCSSNKSINQFHVDYNKSMAEVMSTVAPVLYNEKLSLHPLIYAAHETDIPEDRPSWTPDLEVMRSSPPIVTPNPQEDQPRSPDSHSGITVTDTDLIATGCGIGSVSRISPPTSTKLDDYELWQWSPETLDWTVRNFVLTLRDTEQPQAFRSLVRACNLGRSSHLDDTNLDSDDICDEHGKLFLAEMFYFSSTNTPAPAPAYLGIKASDEWRKHLDQPSEGDEIPSGYTVYEQYNINDQYNPDASLEGNALRLKLVFQHYEIDDIFDEGSLDRVQRHMFNACTRRRLFVLNEDETVIGIGPGAMKPGDVVVQLNGALTPFVLRPFGKAYQFVGDCIIHGKMPHGASAEGPKASTKTKTFRLR